MTNTDRIRIIDAGTMEFVHDWMSHADASHDFQHILRVFNLAMKILDAERQAHPERKYDEKVVSYAAVLHDVGDSKYLPEAKPENSEESAHKFHSLLKHYGLTNSSEVVFQWLAGRPLESHLATQVQDICKCVSYSYEKKNPEIVQSTLEEYPELAIVQDADRLDAIGAIGIGRTFTYTGAKGRKGGMEGTLQHFHEKLLNIQNMMKTDTGQRMAWERTERMKTFLRWWKEEDPVSFIQESSNSC
jgi:uncharacterized protein